MKRVVLALLAILVLSACSSGAGQVSGACSDIAVSKLESILQVSLGTPRSSSVYGTNDNCAYSAARGLVSIEDVAGSSGATLLNAASSSPTASTLVGAGDVAFSEAGGHITVVRMRSRTIQINLGGFSQLSRQQLQQAALSIARLAFAHSA